MSDLYFDQATANRGWYFIKYFPISRALSLAQVELVFAECKSEDEVVAAMESELGVWLKRYPVPTMVSSFDKEGRLISTKRVRSCSHLVGYVGAAGQVVSEWRLLRDDELPQTALDNASLLAIYHDVPYRTGDEVETSVRRSMNRRRWAWFAVFAWIAAIPALIAVLGVASYAVGIATMIFAVLVGIRRTLKMLGKWPKSAAEQEKVRDELLARHHHYHCLRNPAGFWKLKLENFAEDQRKQIEDEHQRIHSLQ